MVCVHWRDARGIRSPKSARVPDALKKAPAIRPGLKSLIAVKALKHLLREEKQETTNLTVYHPRTNLA